MLLTYLDNWLLFTIMFGLCLIVTFIMIRQSRHFYTKDVVVARFSIIELELPASARELMNLIQGLYLLPAEQSKKSISALRAQLKLDFLFMPLAYGSVFLLNWKVAHKIQHPIGYYVFLALACLQLVSWICDIIENVYLLGKINPELKMASTRSHSNYLRMVAIKWGITLSAAICSISLVAYFWLTGNYSTNSFYFFLIALGEIIIFSITVKAFLKITRLHKA